MCKRKRQRLAYIVAAAEPYEYTFVAQDADDTDSADEANTCAPLTDPVSTKQSTPSEDGYRYAPSPTAFQTKPTGDTADGCAAPTHSADA